MVNVAVALGSNLGDRRAHLEYACRRLSGVLADMHVSGFIETDPEGVSPQPRFLNGAVTGATGLGPRVLLETLLAIEAERGRTRASVGAPRTLDLDLILYGETLVDEPGLTVPHPRFRQRRFVLGPLAEIAPTWVDPVTGLTVEALLARLDAAARVG